MAASNPIGVAMATAMSDDASVPMMNGSAP